MFDLTAIFVNHRTAGLCRAAIGSLRATATAEGLRPFVLVVDCGSTAEDAGLLSDAGADRVILLGENRGYSGGLNAGIAAAESRVLLLCNADVLFMGGALRPLMETVSRAPVGAAAPVQFADPGARIYLPTGFGPGFVRDLLQTRGNSASMWERRRFAAAAARQWRLWMKGGEADHLTGSILMTRRDIVDRVGRFDERFPFEYEETEWEDRLRSAGLQLHVVAESRACHLHGSSASRSPEAAQRRRASRELYRRRRWGTVRSRALAWAENRVRLPAAPAWNPRQVPQRKEGYAIAASPNPSVQPFAAAALESGVELSDLFAAIGPSLYLRIFEIATGEPEVISHAVRT